jgi:hypothetical protein
MGISLKQQMICTYKRAAEYYNASPHQVILILPAFMGHYTCITWYVPILYNVREKIVYFHAVHVSLN